MKVRRSGIGATTLALSVLVAVLVASLAFVELSPRSAPNHETVTRTSTVTNTETSTRTVEMNYTSTITQTAAAVSSQSSNGLMMALSLNATGINYGQSISITVDEVNPLPGVNNVTASNDWPALGQPSVLNESNLFSVFGGPCGYRGFPVGGAIAVGYYVRDNISSAKWLQLYPPNSLGVHCPLVGVPGTSFAFQPSSDEAIIQYPYCGPLQCQAPEPVSYSVSFHESYNGNYSDIFGPGVYTVVAGDEWGALTLAHFDVEEMSLRGFSLCSSNCLYPSPYLSGEIYFQGPQLAKSLELFVNGMDEGSLGHGIGNTNVIYLYKGTFQSPPVVAGDVYVITFVVTYADNTTASSTMGVLAG